LADRILKLSQDLKVTSDCCFISANRLRRRDKRVSIIIAVASVMIIAFTVLPFVYRLPTVISGDLSVAIVCTSLVILAASVLHYSRDDGRTAEQHYLYGLEILELWHMLDNKGETMSDDNIAVIAKRYSQVLTGIPYSESDFMRYQIQHPSDFQFSRLERLRMSAKLLLAGESSYVLIIAAMALVFSWFLFWHVLPSRLSG